MTTSNATNIAEKALAVIGIALLAGMASAAVYETWKVVLR